MGPDGTPVTTSRWGSKGVEELVELLDPKLRFTRGVCLGERSGLRKRVVADRLPVVVDEAARRRQDNDITSWVFQVGVWPVLETITCTLRRSDGLAAAGRPVRAADKGEVDDETPSLVTG